MHDADFDTAPWGLTVGAAELGHQLYELDAKVRETGAELDDEARAKAVRMLLEDVAILWPELKTGECRIDLLYDRGKVRRVYVHHGPFRPSELGVALRPSGG